MKNESAHIFLSLMETVKKELREEIASEVIVALRLLIADLLVEQQRHSTALLKESDVVKMYSISRSHLRKLRNESGLPCLKIGDSLRFERSALDSFFKNLNINIKKRNENGK